MLIRKIYRRRFIHPNAQDAVNDYVAKLEQDLFIPVKNGQGKYCKKRCVYNDKENQMDYFFKPEDVHALILYPSLCTPSVIAPGDPLTIFCLINEAQMENIHAGRMIPYPNPYDVNAYAVSELFAYNMWAQLSWSRWSHRRRCKPTTRFKKDYRIERRLFKKAVDTATMSFSEPQKLDSTKALLLEDAQGHCVGRVKQNVVQVYHNRGYLYLVRVTFHEHVLTKPGLYNLAFISLEPREKLKREPGYLSPFQDDQDNLVKKALEAYRTKITHKYEIPTEGPFQFKLDKNDPIQAYHPVYVVDKPKLGVGHLTDVHVSSRQHGFEKCELQVIPGAPEALSPKLGSLINVSYDALKDLMDQMGAESKVDLLFVTGDLVDFNLNWDLTDKLEDVEGFQKIWKDMSLEKDHSRGLVNWFKKNIFGTLSGKRTMRSEEINTLEPQTHLEETHTYGIDNTIIYSLFLYYYDRYQKPIFLTSGNHDAYDLPFGISPRLGHINIDSFSPTEFEKANAGIPMDHNLTFYEAILLFGSEYHTYLDGFNFKPECANWMFHVFSPLSDFSFDYKEQTFTGVEWGDDEEFLTPLVLGGGALPRATQGLVADQLRIVRDACRRYEKHQGENMLFLHPTIVNYTNNLALFSKKEGQNKHQQHQGDIIFGSDFNMYRDDYRHHNEGSFCKGRFAFFDEFITKNKFTHTFSGHSHRSVIYEYVSHQWEERSHLTDPLLTGYDTLPFGTVKTRGYPMEACFIPNYDVQCEYLNGFLNRKQTRIIVTGSGGPVAIRNVYNEMGGEGLTAPTATVMHYESVKRQEIIYAIYAKSKAAKPRFAVALDAFEVKASNWVFRITGNNGPTPIGLSTRRSIFLLEVNPKLPKPTWIKKMTVFLVDQSVLPKDASETYQQEGKISPKNKLADKGTSEREHMKIVSTLFKKFEILFDPSSYQNEKIPITFQGDFPMIFKEARSNVPIYGFLCLEFNPISDDPIYRHYDFSTPWIVYVKMEFCLNDFAQGVWFFSIIRDRKYGEVPNFDFYQELHKKKKTIILKETV